MPMSPRLLRPIAARAGFNFDPTKLVLVFDTSLEPANNTVSVPLNGTVNCSIDWGDGTSESHTTTGFKTKTYANPGVYVVQISGTLTTLSYGNTASTTNNRAKLVRCLSFGNVGLTSLFNGFPNCINLIQCPTTLPSLVTSLFGVFRGCTSFNDSRVGSWNVSNVVGFQNVFDGATVFNQPLASWTPTSATTMAAMFQNASAFNQPIGSWNISNVNDMGSMFQGAVNFNQPLNAWNVSGVRTMGNMFAGANHAFNQPLNLWNVANVTNMNSMFSGSSNAFAQDISSWDIRKVVGMANMFLNSGSTWGTANYDAALEAWADLADTDLTIGTTANTSQAITAFAQQGANTRVTSNGHGLAVGSRVNISGTTSYNGDFNVVAVPGVNQFDIAVTFVANDATGTMRHRRSRNIPAHFGSNQYSAGTPTTKRGVLTGTYLWTITDGGQV